MARAWQNLIDSLEGDERAVDRFATIWLELLPRRLTSCRRALARGDDEVARVRLLSLHSSAVMLGLEELARSTERCRVALDQGDVGVVWAGALARDVLTDAHAAAALVSTALGQARWSKR